MVALKVEVASTAARALPESRSRPRSTTNQNDGEADKSFECSRAGRCNIGMTYVTTVTLEREHFQPEQEPAACSLTCSLLRGMTTQPMICTLDTNRKRSSPVQTLSGLVGLSDNYAKQTENGATVHRAKAQFSPSPGASLAIIGRLRGATLFALQAHIWSSTMILELASCETAARPWKKDWVLFISSSRATNTDTQPAGR